ncbi:Cell morphoproteinsis protein PAG1 [Sphaceloma murrayae]|uniref:Cell morphoproteinsis protein PAG1 n=1 Tax=Sphaceloma murrayae TaxID=2082308 RepID=A0A2K1QKC5_9PEZI|nr:Cell morphoproteinsis protein PAG1 [Sphaceloma murrayae]
MLSRTCLLSLAAGSLAALSDGSLKTFPNSLSLGADFNPVKPAYWTTRPKHRRTPFALSPDGSKAFLAYLDSSGTDVHVQQVDPTTFAAVGASITVAGTKEAGGLVAHNDGFALLANAPTTAQPIPTDNAPIANLYRYVLPKTDAPTWVTPLGGADSWIQQTAGAMSASPDMNGDLVYSEAAGLYGAYYVVTDYQGWAAGHFGDSIQYIDKSGTVQNKTVGSNGWGCSHNTGIALEAADAAPFASMCAEDQGAIWLNTGGKGMEGVKVSNEHTINGASGEPFGGMSGSYSSLARFQGSGAYISAWVSRGAAMLTADSWRGTGYTKAQQRTEYRRVAIATFSDKQTLDGPEASSTVGATDGDSQIKWVSDGPADASNARVATFDGTNALVSWDQIDSPSCTDDAMDCSGTYTGTRYQLITNGQKTGAPITSQVFVSGDQVTMPDGRICWPYVDMKWSLSGRAVENSGPTTKSMSFACMTNGDAGAAAPAPAPSSSAAPASPSAATLVPSSSAAAPIPSSSTPASVPSSSAAAPIPSTSAPAPSPSSSTTVDPAPIPSTTAASVPPTTPTSYDSPPFNPSTAPTSAPSPPVNVPGAGNTPTVIAPSSSVPATADPVPTAGPTGATSACKVEWVTVFV